MINDCQIERKSQGNPESKHQNDRNRYGIGMEYVWNMHGIRVEFVWNKRGIGLEYVWNMYGIALG